MIRLLPVPYADSSLPFNYFYWEFFTNCLFYRSRALRRLAASAARNKCRGFCCYLHKLYYIEPCVHLYWTIESNSKNPFIDDSIFPKTTRWAHQIWSLQQTTSKLAARRTLTASCRAISMMQRIVSNSSLFLGGKRRHTKTFACSGVIGSPIKHAVNSFSKLITPDRCKLGPMQVLHANNFTLFQRCSHAQLSQLRLHWVREVDGTCSKRQWCEWDKQAVRRKYLGEE